MGKVECLEAGKFECLEAGEFECLEAENFECLEAGKFECLGLIFYYSTHEHKNFFSCSFRSLAVRCELTRHLRCSFKFL